MNKKLIHFAIMFSTVFSAVYADKVEQNNIYDDSNIKNDQEAFNEGLNDNSIVDETDTANMFQYSIEFIRESLQNNVDVVSFTTDFLSSILNNKPDFEINKYLDQYICDKNFRFVNVKELQNSIYYFDFVDCFIDLRKIHNNLEEVDIVRYPKVFFMIKMLIFENLLPASKKGECPFNYVFNKNSIKKIFTNQRNRQRINKLIKEDFGIKKNIDFCQYLQFVVLNYIKAPSVNNLTSLFTKYELFKQNETMGRYEPYYSNFIAKLRGIDATNEEFQSSIDIVNQSVTQNIVLLRDFLIMLVDKPICSVKNSDICENEDVLIDKYRGGKNNI